MRAFVWVLIAVGAAGFGTHALLAQDRPAPVFRSGVEVMEVDVSVVDSRGVPVRDLRAPEFTVTVDGQPRRVISAEFIGESSAVDKTPAAPRDPYVSNNTDRRPGRLIMLVIDRNNIDTSTLRGATGALTRFVKSLAPDDRVSLMTVPPPGPSVDFTSNHEHVITAIGRIVGGDEAMPSRYNVSPYEALAFDTGSDPLAVQRLLFRVCGDTDPTRMSPCDRDVEQEAGAFAAYLRQQTAQSVSSLSSLLLSLADVPGPKSMIILSQGLMLEGSQADASALAALAAESRVSVNVLMFALQEGLASQSRVSDTPNQDRDLREGGLETLASRSRGSLFRVAASPEPIFDRVRTEISAHYLLGVEPAERDRDGRTHQIRVQVGRSGVQVRSRRQIKYTVRQPNTWSRDVLMGRVLRSPAANTELPMRVSTYTFRDQTPGKVKVIIAAEIDPESMEKDLDLAIGFAVFDQTGKPVVAGQERKLYSANSDVPVRYEVAIGVDPGNYRLRLAAIDAAGKSGSVERDVAAFGMTNHEFAVGDLILRSIREGTTGDLRAPVILQVADPGLGTYTELYTSKPGALDGTNVTFEVAVTEDGPALHAAAADLREGDDRTSRQAFGLIPVESLPPGRYIARALFTRGSASIGKLTRPFEIVPRAAGATSGAPSGSPGVARTPLTGVVMANTASAFKKEDVLTPEMLRAVFEAVDKNHPAAKAATARARSGKLDGTAMMALDAGDQEAGSLLRGLELFAKGQLDGAATQFGVALRNPIDMPIASLYLGACYAAAGRDKEAVSAWERSRTRLRLPGLSRLLADAWLRLGQPARAVQPLGDLLDLEPGNDSVRRSLAIAQSRVGAYDESYATVMPFLERNPVDADALLVALHALYQARLGGRVLVSADDDKARAAAYAHAYVEGNGPQSALVQKWAEFLTK